MAALLRLIFLQHLIDWQALKSLRQLMNLAKKPTLEFLTRLNFIDEAQTSRKAYRGSTDRSLLASSFRCCLAGLTAQTRGSREPFFIVIRSGRPRSCAGANGHHRRGPRNG
jgi:hypothetical protein